MIKEIKKIANNTVDFLNLEENHLSIQLRLDGFSFCIYNKVFNKFGYFADFDFSGTHISPFKHLELVEEIFKKEDVLQLKYKTVSVIHFNNLVAQVPKTLFNKNNLTHYLKHTVKVLENDFITFDEINNSEIINVYIPFVNINNFLLDTYGSFIFKHSSTVLIENLLNEYKNAEGDFCFVNVTNKNFELIVLKNKKFKLFNNFSFNSKEDFIYYILFTAEQLNLNPEEFKLIFLGDIEKESELYAITYQYVRNVNFYTSSNTINGLSQHSNFALLNQI